MQTYDSNIRSKLTRIAKKHSFQSRIASQDGIIGIEILMQYSYRLTYNNGNYVTLFGEEWTFCTMETIYNVIGY